ncbi:MAG: cytidine deaminase [Christensenellales bacterium]|jgi:homotetrameric cytidine deaminase/rRNA maturation RNase YbeY
MIELSIETSGAPEGLSALFEAVTAACFRAEGISEKLIAVKIVDDETIREINRETRGIDARTDVLSFPSVRYPPGKTARDCPKRLRREFLPARGMAHLGDCAISLPRARAQAAEYGHSLSRELGYLIAHAAFHLMGYDHMTDADKARMREMEKRAMREIGLWRDTDMTNERLYALAEEAMERAYSPYSNFKVGACLLASDGRVFQGCNFENASYGATICAERCAVGNAIVNGARRFTKIAVAGSAAVAWPCGICRQVIREFADADMRVIVGEYGKGYQVRTLGELLPEAFGPDELGIEE